MLLYNYSGHAKAGTPKSGDAPRSFLYPKGVLMAELSVFVDESGDFGSNSQYYLLALFFIIKTMKYKSLYNT